ncbi:MAG: hypothetical protein AAGF23_21270, partial [Acidobacteriota bacterium]
DYFDFIRRTLEALRTDGRLRDVDTTTATFSLLGIVMWLSRWYQTDGRMSGDAVVDDVTEIALRGVLADADAAPGFPAPGFPAAGLPPGGFPPGGADS